MNRLIGASAIAAAMLLVAACDQTAADPAASENAASAAGDNTIASGLEEGSTFAAAAKASGLDATLAGPGPYTVLVPRDEAFQQLPAGALDTLMKPESRADLTGLLSLHILPGTMLSSDIATAIDKGGGTASIATMGGGTLTATREGEAIVLADGAGTKARVVNADMERSNGVVHQIDAVLMPDE